MDPRSIYVGQVDYTVSENELKQHFSDCGEVVRVTIPKNSNLMPKGFAYLQFATDAGMQNALVSKNGSLLAGRQLMVKPKRITRPGVDSHQRDDGELDSSQGIPAEVPTSTASEQIDSETDPSNFHQIESFTERMTKENKHQLTEEMWKIVNKNFPGMYYELDRELTDEDKRYLQDPLEDMSKAEWDEWMPGH